MPVPHLEIRIVQRSKGSSAVAGAAYQAGEKLFSEYDQKMKNYLYKKEVVYTEVMAICGCLTKRSTDRNVSADDARILPRAFCVQGNVL